MATIEKEKAILQPERRMVLHGISWELYEQLRENGRSAAGSGG